MVLDHMGIRVHSFKNQRFRETEDVESAREAKGLSSTPRLMSHDASRSTIWSLSNLVENNSPILPNHICLTVCDVLVYCVFLFVHDSI